MKRTALVTFGGVLLLCGILAGSARAQDAAPVNPEIERVVRNHREHHPATEHAGLAEHTPHRDAAERSELLAQEIGKAVAGNHLPTPSRESFK